MLRIISFFIVVAISMLLSGCNSSKQTSKAARDPYSTIQLGMSIDDAKKLVAGDGKNLEHDKLPVSPKPRDVYSKLPSDAEWLVWSGDGKCTLIFGVVDNKVVFKQVVSKTGGQLKSDANAPPAYQCA